MFRRYTWLILVIALVLAGCGGVGGNGPGGDINGPWLSYISDTQTSGGNTLAGFCMNLTQSGSAVTGTVTDAGASFFGTGTTITGTLNGESIILNFDTDTDLDFTVNGDVGSSGSLITGTLSYQGITLYFMGGKDNAGNTCV